RFYFFTLLFVNDLYICLLCLYFFFFSSRRRHTRSLRDWSSDVCSSDLAILFLSYGWFGFVLYSLASIYTMARPYAPREPRQERRSEERRVGKECRSRWSA